MGECRLQTTRVDRIPEFVNLSVSPTHEGWAVVVLSWDVRVSVPEPYTLSRFNLTLPPRVNFPETYLLISRTEPDRPRSSVGRQDPTLSEPTNTRTIVLRKEPWYRGRNRKDKGYLPRTLNGFPTTPSFPTTLPRDPIPIPVSVTTRKQGGTSTDEYPERTCSQERRP